MALSIDELTGISELPEANSLTSFEDFLYCLPPDARAATIKMLDAAEKIVREATTSRTEDLLAGIALSQIN